MADLDKIMTALRNAHAAGDTAAATRLAAMAKAAQGASRKNVGPDGMTPGERAKAAREGTLKAPSDDRLARQAEIDAGAEVTMRDPGLLPTLAAAGASGATFGFADEIVGAGGAAMGGARDLLTGNWSGMADRAASRYASDRDFARMTLDDARNARPKTAIAAEIAGAVALPIGAVGAGGGLLRSSAQNALAGMGLAGLYGFGTGEGGLQNRAENALAAAPLGFAVGAAAPVLASAIAGTASGVASAGRGVIDRLRGTASQKAADRAIARVIEKSGQSPDDIVAALRRAAAEGQPEYRLMDATGQAGQRAASTVVRRGDDGAEEMAAFLRQRQTDQSARVPRMIEEAYDAKVSAAKTAENMNKARKAANDVNYPAAAANAGPVNLSGTVDTIDELLRRNPIVGEAAFARSEIGNRLATLRGQLASDKGMRTDFQAVLEIKEDLGGIIGGLKRAGKEVPRQLAAVFGKLDEALEDASDGYRKANDTARAARQNIAAIEEGADMARPGARSQDTTARFANMTDEQKTAARVGYADRVLAQIEANKAVTANKASPFNSTKAAEESAAMTRNPDMFRGQIKRENEMWGTMNRALGGSRTADNLMDDAMAIPTDGPARQAIVDALRLNFGSAVTNLAIAVAPALRGQSPATRKIIGEALMSGETATVLRAMAQTVKDQAARSEIVRAIRSAGAVTTGSSADRFVARDAYGRPLPKPEY